MRRFMLLKIMDAIEELETQGYRETQIKTELANMFKSKRKIQQALELAGYIR